jgi:poly-gamma-glutamate synthesis protein (capsule biosynthesis protein)
MPLAVEAANGGQLTFMFGGDVMLGRAVRDQIVKKGNNQGSWVMQNLASDFKKADLAFVNLESPFAAGSALGYGLVFRADPKHIIALTSAGIDAVSFANNHSRNQGSIGIQTTLSLLQKNSIKAPGAGLNSNSAYSSQYLEVKGQKVAFLAYTYNEKLPSKYLNQPTIASMDTTRMQKEVKKAKAGGALVIVYMHAGTEYTLTITNQQKNFAHAAIDAGAELVVGSHPHWVQKLEKYKSKAIIYSLGNLVFDQPWSTETQQGAVAKVIIQSGKVQKVQILPIKIDFASKPRWMNQTEAAKVLKRIGLPSGAINL